MDFPSKVYKLDNLKPNGFGSLLVRDEKELTKALESGWFKTVPEAKAGEPVEAPARRTRKPKE